MANEINTPGELANWIFDDMLPDEVMLAYAGSIEEMKYRIACIIIAERAVPAGGPPKEGNDPAQLRPSTMQELRQSSVLIRKWMPEAFPTYASGQKHFVRCVMESVAEVIERALLEYGVDAVAGRSGLVMPPECDCAAEADGKWADVHSPGCASLKAAG